LLKPGLADARSRDAEDASVVLETGLQRHVRGKSWFCIASAFGHLKRGVWSVVSRDYAAWPPG
jgi:hypothetical protein